MDLLPNNVPNQTAAVAVCFAAVLYQFADFRANTGAQRKAGGD
jgi:hypothetical protein